jgi:hypothetical protein
MTSIDIPTNPYDDNAVAGAPVGTPDPRPRRTPPSRPPPASAASPSGPP